MRLLRLLLLICVGIWQSSTALLAGEYQLIDGDVIRGEPVAFNDDGMVVRLDIGGYSPQISWSKLTQDSLKELANNPKAANFVEPFIDIPPVSKEKEKKKKEIVVRPVPRVERIAGPNLFASIATPAGIAVFLVLFLANLYAAYEIARFRNRSPALVCGVSALLPVIAPASFLLMPGAPEPEAADQAMAEAAVAAQTAGKTTTGPLPKTPMASGLSISHQEKAGGAGGEEPQTYKRGEFTFNRRFFETKFPNFFRVVSSDPNLILALRTAKTEHVAKRISRISSTEVHVQLVRGGLEVGVPFPEIVEVQVRRQEVKV